MKPAVLFLCFSGLVMGYDETCKGNGESCVAPEDEVALMQTRTQVHKHSRMTDTDMHEVLASFEEKEGPVAMQQLVRGVMGVPVLKSEEAMLAAVRAQPQLQQLAKRYPHSFLHTLSIFDDPKAIQQIKAAVFKTHRSPKKMQGRQPSALTQERLSVNSVLSQAQSRHSSAASSSKLLAWLEGYGCEAELGVTDFPDASMGVGTFPIFGPDCQGHPYISDVGVSAKDEGAYIVFGNYSEEDMRYTYNAAFVDETGLKDLGSLGEKAYQTAIHTDAIYLISEDGDWPNYTYQLKSATSDGVKEVVNITNCRYPSLYSSGSDAVMWQCSRDWEKANDTNKLMKYSPGVSVEPEIVIENEEWVCFVTIQGSRLYYSMYGQKANSSDWGNVLYSCAMDGIDACNLKPPTAVGELPGGMYEFIVTESSELISTAWTSWRVSSSSGSEHWTTYNVTVSPLDDLGLSRQLFSIGGNSHLQLIETHPGPEDLNGGAGPPGPPGPAGPPGPPGLPATTPGTK